MESRTYEDLPEEKKKILRDTFGDPQEVSVDELKNRGIDRLTFFEAKRELNNKINTQLRRGGR